MAFQTSKRDQKVLSKDKSKGIGVQTEIFLAKGHLSDFNNGHQSTPQKKSPNFALTKVLPIFRALQLPHPATDA